MPVPTGLLFWALNFFSVMGILLLKQHQHKTESRRPGLICAFFLEIQMVVPATLKALVEYLTALLISKPKIN
jgi:hypothetical protein